QQISAIPDDRYAVKGLHNRDTISVAVADVGAAGRTAHEVRYEFIRGTGFSQGYLDFILLDVTRDLSLHDNQIFFLSAASTMNPVSTFRITGLKNGVHVWDITDHYNIRTQAFSVNGTEGKFSAS